MEYGRGRKSSWRRCSRHLACCGFLFLVLCQASGCGDNASPPAPTPPPVAANHSPVASAAVIPDQALPVGRNAATVDMAPYFTDLDGDTLTYTVVSSDAGVVTASVSGSTVTLTPVSAGATTVAVTAMDPGGATATRSIAVTVGQGSTHGGSDLVVESPGVSSPTMDPEEEFTFSTTVRNVGDGDAAATTLRYYLSTDATISTSDTEVGTDTVAELAVSASSDESVTLAAPMTAGTYYYGACVGVVAGESDTTNNCSSSVAVTVVEPEPPVAANHSPVASAAVIPDQALPVGRNAVTVDVALYFIDLDGDTLTYTAVSSDAGVVIASVSGSTVTLTPVSAGATTVAVTAMDPGGATATRSIAVTVQESEPPPPSTPDLVVESPGVSDSNPDRQHGVHVLGDSTERREWRCSVHDAALLPLDGRDGHDIRTREIGYGRGASACPSARLRGNDSFDGAIHGRHVLLRRVRGRGARGIRHDEQLLGISAGRGNGASASASSEHTGPGGGTAVGERQQPGDGRNVHVLGDGTERR